MSNVSEENKTIAKTAPIAFGGAPRVTQYGDDDRKSFVDLLKCVDRPQNGVTSYCTIGTSDYPLIKDGKEFPVRVEFVGACGNNISGFDRVLTTAAFCVINSKWFCCPGAIFPGILSMYKCSATLQHLFFIPPFLWEKDLQTLKLPGKTVAWLLAVPISESERNFSLSCGSDKLEELFEDRQIDIFDLNRPPVV